MRLVANHITLFVSKVVNYTREVKKKRVDWNKNLIIAGKKNQLIQIMSSFHLSKLKTCNFQI